MESHATEFRIVSSSLGIRIERNDSEQFYLMCRYVSPDARYEIRDTRNEKRVICLVKSANQITKIIALKFSHEKCNGECAPPGPQLLLTNPKLSVQSAGKLSDVK